jgi:hypothetical protein
MTPEATEQLRILLETPPSELIGTSTERRLDESEHAAGTEPENLAAALVGEATGRLALDDAAGQMRPASYPRSR